jgi:hypothetical protein
MLRKAALPFILVLSGLVSLLYYKILTVSLGPHVILEPWLINQGFRIYAQLADNHSPLMPLLLSFGQLIIPDGLTLARLVLAGLIFIIAIQTYFLTKQLAGSLAGVLSVIFFTCWSQSFGYGKLWHETFLTPLYLLLIIVWLPPPRHTPFWRYGIYGLILGVSLLVKQQALYLIAGLIVYQCLLGFLTHKKARKLLYEIGLIGVGVALPGVIFAINYLVSGGQFSDLWYWTVAFNDLEMVNMLALAPTASYLIAISPALILMLVFLVKFARKVRSPIENWAQDGLLILVFLSGTITAYPRFGAFHLQPMLPVLALISGRELISLIKSRQSRNLETKIKLNYVIAALIVFYWVGIGLSGFISPSDQRKIFEYSNLPPLADQVRQQIGTNACLYIMPEDEANSNLYYLLKCLPPRFWAFTSYPWYSRNGLPDREIDALKTASPEWVLYFPARWDIEKHNPSLIKYVMSQYQKVGSIKSAEGVSILMKKISP